MQKGCQWQAFCIDKASEASASEAFLHISMQSPPAAGFFPSLS